MSHKQRTKRKKKKEHHQQHQQHQHHAQQPPDYSEFDDEDQDNQDNDIKQQSMQPRAGDESVGGNTADEQIAHAIAAQEVHASENPWSAENLEMENEQLTKQNDELARYKVLYEQMLKKNQAMQQVLQQQQQNVALYQQQLQQQQLLQQQQQQLFPQQHQAGDQKQATLAPINEENDNDEEEVLAVHAAGIVDIEIGRMYLMQDKDLIWRPCVAESEVADMCVWVRFVRCNKMKQVRVVDLLGYDPDKLDRDNNGIKRDDPMMRSKTESKESESAAARITRIATRNWVDKVENAGFIAPPSDYPLRDESSDSDDDDDDDDAPIGPFAQLTLERKKKQRMRREHGKQPQATSYSDAAQARGANIDGSILPGSVLKSGFYGNIEQQVPGPGSRNDARAASGVRAGTQDRAGDDAAAAASNLRLGIGAYDENDELRQDQNEEYQSSELTMHDEIAALSKEYREYFEDQGKRYQSGISAKQLEVLQDINDQVKIAEDCGLGQEMVQQYRMMLLMNSNTKLKSEVLEKIDFVYNGSDGLSLPEVAEKFAIYLGRNGINPKEIRSLHLFGSILRGKAKTIYDLYAHQLHSLGELCGLMHLTFRHHFNLKEMQQNFYTFKQQNQSLVLFCSIKLQRLQRLIKCIKMINQSNKYDRHTKSGLIFDITFPKQATVYQNILNSLKVEKIRDKAIKLDIKSNPERDIIKLFANIKKAGRSYDTFESMLGRGQQSSGQSSGARRRGGGRGNSGNQRGRGSWRGRGGYGRAYQPRGGYRGGYYQRGGSYGGYRGGYRGGYQARGAYRGGGYRGGRGQSGAFRGGGRYQPQHQNQPQQQQNQPPTPPFQQRNARGRANQQPRGRARGRSRGRAGRGRARGGNQQNFVMQRGGHSIARGRGQGAGRGDANRNRLNANNHEDDHKQVMMMQSIIKQEIDDKKQIKDEFEKAMKLERDEVNQPHQIINKEQDVKEDDAMKLDEKTQVERSYAETCGLVKKLQYLLELAAECIKKKAKGFEEIIECMVTSKLSINNTAAMKKFESIVSRVSNVCNEPHPKKWEPKKGFKGKKKVHQQQKKKHRKKKQKVFVYNSLERVNMQYYGIDPDKIPNEGMVTLTMMIRGKAAGEQPVHVNHRTLTDEGATISVVDREEAMKTVEQSKGEIVWRKGQKMMVENGGGEDIEYSGEFIEVPVQKPTKTRNYVVIRYYISPVKLCYKWIIGRNDMPALGYKMALIDDDGTVFVHKREPIFDITSDSTVWEQMDYWSGRNEDIKREDNNKEQEVEEDVEKVMLQDEQKQAIDKLLEEKKVEANEELLKLLDLSDIASSVKDNVLQEIRVIVLDVALRRSYEIANGLKSILMKYYDRLSSSKFDIGRIEGFYYRIPLKPGAQPVSCRPYPCSPLESDEMDQITAELEEEDFIEEYSGPWGSPALITWNADGSSRMCVDYSLRNKVTEDLAYPCPDINTTLLEFHDARVFSKFDITKAFYNIPVHPDDKEKTAFVTKNGAFCFKVMPFGGKRCPATWAQASDHIFKNCRDLIKYIDDLAVASRDDASHLIALEEFFERLAASNLKIKLSKCLFFRDEIPFVGHIISKDGISADKKYVNDVVKLKRPEGKPEIGSWVGFVGWLAKYVYGLKEAMEPIGRMKRKSVRFQWEEEQEKSYLHVKHLIDNCDILAMPNWNKDFILYTDSSDKAYGAVLLQEDDEGMMRPIEFMSRTWDEGEEKWAITAKELAALVLSVEKFDKYLKHRPFIIHTDAKNIEWMFKRIENRQKRSNPMHNRWLLRMKPYNFEAHHIPGVDNVVADWLSRYNNYEELAAEEAAKNMDNIKEIVETEHDEKQYKDTKLQNANICHNRVFVLNHCMIKGENERILSNQEFIKEWGGLGEHIRANQEFIDELTNYGGGEHTTNPKNLQSIAKKNQYVTPDNQHLFYINLKKLRKSDHFEVFANHVRGDNSSNSTDSEETEPTEATSSMDDDEEQADRARNHNLRRSPRLNRLNLQEFEDMAQEQAEEEESSIFDEANPIIVRLERDIDLDMHYEYELMRDGTLEHEFMFDLDKLRRNQRTDPMLNIVRNYLEDNDPTEEYKELPPRMKADLMRDRYYINDETDLIMINYPYNRKRLIVLPAEHRKAFLHYYHHNIFTGLHVGARAMAKELIKLYYWPGYYRDVTFFVSKCHTCQIARSVRRHNVGKLKLFTPTKPGEMVAVDHKGPILPPTPRGNRYITSIIDRFSGRVCCYAVPSIGAKRTALTLMEFFNSEGVPTKLLSDQGTDFMSNTVTDVVDLCGIVQLESGSYYPQTNGTTERWNKTLTVGLRCIAEDNDLDFHDGDDWDFFVKAIAANHNNKFSSRIGMSPNEAHFGYQVKLPIDHNTELRLRPINEYSWYQEHVSKLQKISVEIAKLRLDRYDAVRKEYYDRRRQDIELKVGDYVIYYHGHTHEQPKVGKLKTKWRGPYKIAKIKNEGMHFVIYRRDDIVHTNIHKIKRYYFEDDDKEQRFNQSVRHMERRDDDENKSDDYEPRSESEHDDDDIDQNMNEEPSEREPSDHGRDIYQDFIDREEPEDYQAIQEESISPDIDPSYDFEANIKFQAIDLPENDFDPDIDMIDQEVLDHININDQAINEFVDEAIMQTGDSEISSSPNIEENPEEKQMEETKTTGNEYDNIYEQNLVEREPLVEIVGDEASYTPTVIMSSSRSTSLPLNRGDDDIDSANLMELDENATTPSLGNGSGAMDRPFINGVSPLSSLPSIPENDATINDASHQSIGLVNDLMNISAEEDKEEQIMMILSKYKVLKARKSKF